MENAAGDILRLDRKSKKIIGCTIPAFAERAARGTIVIPEVGPVPFNDFAKELVNV